MDGARDKLKYMSPMAMNLRAAGSDNVAGTLFTTDGKFIKINIGMTTPMVSKLVGRRTRTCGNFDQTN